MFFTLSWNCWIACSFPVAQREKGPPAARETWLRSLGWEGPLEKGTATRSCILAWRIPWQRSLVGYTVRGAAESGPAERLSLLAWLSWAPPLLTADPPAPALHAVTTSYGHCFSSHQPVFAKHLPPSSSVHLPGSKSAPVHVSARLPRRRPVVPASGPLPAQLRKLPDRVHGVQIRWAWTVELRMSGTAESRSRTTRRRSDGAGV